MSIRTFDAPPEYRATTLEAGTRVGRYQVRSFLGGEGRGKLYQVRHQTLDSAYALLVLEGLGPEEIRDVESEGKRRSRLSHPHIVRIHDVFQVGEYPALLMDYVDGGSLEERLQRGEIPREEGIQICRQLLEAMEYARGEGGYLGGLRASGILLGQTGTQTVVKITGLGLFLDGDSSGSGPESEPDRAEADRKALAAIFAAIFPEISPDRGKRAAESVSMEAPSWEELRQWLVQLGAKKGDQGALAPPVQNAVGRRERRKWMVGGLVFFLLIGAAAGLPFFAKEGSREAPGEPPPGEERAEQEEWSFLAVSSDGRREARVGLSGMVQILEMESGEEMTRFSAFGERLPAEAVFTPDGAFLVLLPGGTEVDSSKRAAPARVFSVETGKRVHSLAHGTRATRVVISSRGQWAATAGEDHRVILWDLVTGAPESTFLASEVGWRVACLAFEPEGDRLVTVYEDRRAKGEISSYEPTQGTVLTWRERREELPSGYRFSGRCEVRFGEDGAYEILSL